MKITVLSDSFCHRVGKQDANKSNKVSIEIQFESQGGELSRYQAVKEQLDFTNIVANPREEKVSIAPLDSDGRLNLNCSSSDETLDVRDIIDKIGLCFQKHRIINIKQYNALATEAYCFKQVDDSDKGLPVKYHQFALVITGANVTSRLDGKVVEKGETKAVNVPHKTDCEPCEERVTFGSSDKFPYGYYGWRGGAVPADLESGEAEATLRQALLTY